MRSDFAQTRREAVAAGYAAVWTPQAVHLLEDWAPEEYWERFAVDRRTHQLRVESDRSGMTVRDRYQLVRESAAVVDELRRAAAQHAAPDAPEPDSEPDTGSVRPDSCASGWLFGPPNQIGAIGL